VVEGLILETTFLVDLERERRREEVGRAQKFLSARPEERLWLTMTTVGELASGAGDSERADWESLVAPFGILPIDMDVCWSYGSTFRYLADNGLLIGPNDLWIAAAALANNLPLATRNVRHFKRVPGLRVAEY
jgi:predicted nucleic acid-binding protein